MMLEHGVEGRLDDFGCALGEQREAVGELPQFLLAHETLKAFTRPERRKCKSELSRNVLVRRGPDQADFMASRLQRPRGAEHRMNLAATAEHRDDDS